MEIRQLQSEEYGMLDDIPEEHRVALNPDNTIVAVAIDDGNIKARLVAIDLPHIEAAWIDPEYRNGIILGKLESILTSKLKSLGASMALAFAINETMESYVKRLGYKQLGTVWRKDI